MRIIALFEPEIPSNTGNIIRLCANTGFTLHLIEPLGFTLDDKKLKRAGLDYHEYSDIQVHSDYSTFLNHDEIKNSTLYGLTTKAKRCYSAPAYPDNIVLLLGPETRGLPTHILESLPENKKIRIPMQPYSRSLNLSNAAAIVAYEYWRQQSFL